MWYWYLIQTEFLRKKLFIKKSIELTLFFSCFNCNLYLTSQMAERKEYQL